LNSTSKKHLLFLLYPSVFLGPFGGNTVLALIPSLERFFTDEPWFIPVSIMFYMIPFAFFQLFSGALSDIYGRKRIILFGLFTFSLASLFCASSNTTGLFLGARALQGLGSAFIAPTIMAVIGDVFPYKERGRVMGGYGASTTAGIALGPLVAGFFAIIDWRLVFQMLFLFSGLLGSVYLFYFDASKGDGELKDVLRKIGGVLKNKGLLVLCMIGFLVFFGYIATMTFLSNTLKIAVSEDKIGILLSTVGFIGIPTAPVAGYLTDFIGRKKTLLVGLAIMLSAFLILLHVNTYESFFIPLAIMGTGSTTIFTSLNTMIVECVPESRGAASSIYNSFRFLGYGLAPVASLPVYLVYGLQGIVLLCVCFVVMNILISMRVRG
jgi:DHA1 family multidrug resistance protein-like MFS transporter